MATIKIGIVENEIIIARTIQSTLKQLGYLHCGPADTYSDAIEMIENEKPDLLLLDINLTGARDGIDVAGVTNEKYKIPFIFLTAIADEDTLNRARAVKPHAYILKPFSKEELFMAIEIALSNFSLVKSETSPHQQQTYSAKDFAFYKDGQNFHKVFYNEIHYIQTEDNYTTVFCNSNRKIVVRSTFSEMFQSLPANDFAQTHRSFAVNLSKITSVEALDVIIGEAKVPISKSYREAFLEKLGI